MMLRLDLEHLVAAAVHITGHGEDLAVRHLAADNRIESAAPGWTGRSARALSTRTSRWVSTSAAMVSRVGEHATDLHTGALRFSALESMNARALCAPDSSVRQLPVRQRGSAIR